MKRKTLSIIISGLILFQSCVAQKLSQSIENAIGERLYAKFSGSVYVKPTSSNSYLLLVNTNNSSDSYDKAIIVFTAADEVKPIFDEQSTYEFFIPNNKRFIVIYNQKADRIFIAGLSDKAAKQAIERFKSSTTIRAALTNKDITGYGLAYKSGTIWNISKVKESKYKSPFYTLDYANMTDPTAAAALPPDDDGGGDVSCAKGTCTSGGAGSSSCSITEAPLGQSCTVTCNAGYYACCVSGTVRCYCCKIQ